MKNTWKYIGALAFAAAAFIGCSDWTDVEAQQLDKLPGEKHYEALRAYKASPHQIVFGWFSEWTGQGVGLKNSLIGIPDSMDLVSIWGSWHSLTPAQKNDLKEVRKRGTKILFCFIVSDIGTGTTPSEVKDQWIVDGVKYNSQEEALAKFWGWYGSHGDTSPEGIEKAIRKYARSILDTVNKYGYDGFDYDYEPHYGYGGNISSYTDRSHIFLSELATELGPQSGTDKILMVDGEPQTLAPESGPLLNYYVIQAYDCRGYTDLDRRLSGLIGNFERVESKETIMSKLIWCENFEKWQNTGGPEYTDRDGSKTYSLMGMARYYNPDIDAKIAGVGAYRFNLHRAINDYIVMREVIQQLNPAHPEEAEEK